MLNLGILFVKKFINYLFIIFSIFHESFSIFYQFEKQ